MKNNKNICKKVYEDKEYELEEYITNTSNKGTLEVKLTNINDITDMSYMFYHCSSLLSLPDISKWDTSNVTNMNSLFFNCKSIEALSDISNRDVSNVVDISFMFYYCLKLKALPGYIKLGYNQS